VPSDPMTTRAEHLAWCKQRALEYVEQDDYPNALASMMSDLGKHPYTLASANPELMRFGLAAAARGREAMRKFIEDFN